MGHQVNGHANEPARRIYCGECGRTETGTVVRLDDNRAQRTNCSAQYEARDIGLCGWCGEMAADAKGDRFNPGCPGCAIYLMRTQQSLTCKQPRHSYEDTHVQPKGR